MTGVFPKQGRGKPCPYKDANDDKGRGNPCGCPSQGGSMKKKKKIQTNYLGRNDVDKLVERLSPEIDAISSDDGLWLDVCVWLGNKAKHHAFALSELQRLTDRGIVCILDNDKDSHHRDRRRLRRKLTEEEVETWHRVRKKLGVVVTLDAIKGRNKISGDEADLRWFSGALYQRSILSDQA
jgi:hypothetical protein